MGVREQKLHRRLGCEDELLLIVELAKIAHDIAASGWSRGQDELPLSFCGSKPELAEATLRRIVDLFPNQSQSQMALDRITTLGLELKRFETTSVVKFSPSESADRVR